jgi:hypothetical protein
LWEQTWGLEQAAAGTGERWSEAEAARCYQTVLKDAGKIANRSVGKGFEEQRQRTWGEVLDRCGASQRKNPFSFSNQRGNRPLGEKLRHEVGRILKTLQRKKA